MTKPKYLLTLHAGDSTREISYRVHQKDAAIAMLEESDWDFPVLEPISQADIEAIGSDCRSRPLLRMTGPQYLRLADTDSAMEGMLEAIGRGKEPSAALEQALAAAALYE